MAKRVSDLQGTEYTLLQTEQEIAHVFDAVGEPTPAPFAFVKFDESGTEYAEVWAAYSVALDSFAYPVFPRRKCACCAGLYAADDFRPDDLTCKHCQDNAADRLEEQTRAAAQFGTCPQCGETDLYFDSLSVEDGRVVQPVSCPCGASWNEWYTPDNFVLTDHGEKPAPAHCSCERCQ